MPDRLAAWQTNLWQRRVVRLFDDAAKANCWQHRSRFRLLLGLQEICRSRNSENEETKLGRSKIGANRQRVFGDNYLGRRVAIVDADQERLLHLLRRCHRQVSFALKRIGQDARQIPSPERIRVAMKTECVVSR
jgi:hypothetical protein